MRQHSFPDERISSKIKKTSIAPRTRRRGYRMRPGHVETDARHGASQRVR
jgi:hypothetical protein